MRLPLLFLYGRKDSTISYMGANIYPQDVEYGLYHDNPHAHLLQTFCLELEEHSDLECRPIVNLQLREDAALDPGERKALADTCRDGVLAHLVAVSRDFAAVARRGPVRRRPAGQGARLRHRPVRRHERRRSRTPTS